MTFPDRFYSVSDVTDPLSLVTTADDVPGAHPTRPDPPLLRESLRYAEMRLADVGVPSPRVDAELLAAHVLGIDRGQLLGAAYARTTVPERFWELLGQREARVPVQHLTGRVWFRRLALVVGPGVFIPRPETEDVAGAAIGAAATLAAGSRAPVVVDLCTGSAAIALAVADEVPTAQVHAVDVDANALAWAERNVHRLDSGARVSLEQGDLGVAAPHLVGAVDVVVSNPPYIPPGMVPVDPEVAAHDPELALFGGGEDGLDLPRRVIIRARELLRPGGFFAMEHAETQQIAIMRMLHVAGWANVTGCEDMSGRPRYVTATRPG